jgi:hypothetical protein
MLDKGFVCGKIFLVNLQAVFVVWMVTWYDSRVLFLGVFWGFSFWKGEVVNCDYSYGFWCVSYENNVSLKLSRSVVYKGRLNTRMASAPAPGIFSLETLEESFLNMCN